MQRQLIIGQLICITALLLLFTLVPFMPRVSGLPRHRVAEMCVFWITQWMLVIGMGQTLGATMQHRTAIGIRISVLAAVGVFVAMFVCFIALTNLTFSSIQGAGLRMPGTHSMRLFPRELGYLFAVPLFFSLVCQLPVFALFSALGDYAIVQQPWRIARLVLQIVLVFVLFVFLGTVLLFIGDRWYAVLSVVSTWFASLPFLGLGIAQIIWAKSAGQRFTPR